MEATMRMNGATEIAPDSSNPKTHRIGWQEITDLARIWHEMDKGEQEIRRCKRVLEEVLESIDPRWRQV